MALFPMIAAAQVEADVEQWVEETDDVEAASGWSDALAELRASPVNINDTHALAQWPLLSPFQHRALCNYILLHGQLLSLDELRFVPGFDSVFVVRLAPLVVVKPCVEQRRWLFGDGRHTLVTALGGAVERALGYDDGSYEGDRLRALAVYQYSLYDKLNVRLVAEKDATEAWGKGNFVAWHLSLTDVGRVERLIVGRYNLQFGQGLTLWSGLRPFDFMGGTTMRYGQGVRTASALYESGYQEGVAARLRVSRGVALTAFGSHALGQSLAGGHVDFRRGNLLLGVTAAWLRLDSVAEVRDYAYNQLRFRGQRQVNAGVDFMYQWRHATFYGEGSVGENGAVAAVGGARWMADSDTRLGVSFRAAQAGYHNLMSQPYAIGSGQGEQGMTVEAACRLPLGLRFLGHVDVHRFNMLRYGTYAPSSGTWLRSELSRSWTGSISAFLRFSYRLKERNIPNLDSTLYLGEMTVRRQWQGEVRRQCGDWTLAGRAVWTQFAPENGSMQQGMLVGLWARHAGRRLQSTVGAALFEVDGYYARIYYSESNLQYAWSMPSLTGRGARAYAVLRWTVADGCVLAAKYALTFLPGEASIGSGVATTEGPLRQTWMAQMRWHF